MMTPTVDKIKVPSDPRVRWCTALLNGRNYGYLLGVPRTGKFHHTIFLIHGWPDLSMGWRYQIPMFLELGFRVVAPDCIGYGRSDAPEWSDQTAHAYTYKTAADDMKALANQLGAEKIILGGHDWGGAIVYRIALWHPHLVSHIFAVCTPYVPPTAQWLPPEQLVRRLPNLRYQLHLSSGEIERAIRTKDDIRMFLNGLFGGFGPNREVAVTAEKGIDLDVLGKLRKTKLFDDEELEYYVNEYSRSGIHGSLNWYRTSAQNFRDELELDMPMTILHTTATAPTPTTPSASASATPTTNATASTTTSTTKHIITCPVLLLRATKDAVLRPEMSRNMHRYVENLRIEDVVGAGHWVLWEKPGVVNSLIREWLLSASVLGVEGVSSFSEENREENREEKENKEGSRAVNSSKL